MDKLTLLNLTPILIVLLDLAAWGIVYAARIKNHPTLRTYVSVIIGVAIPLTAITLIIGWVLWVTGHFPELWPILPIPWLIFGVPAIPMILIQEIKHREQLDG